MGIKPLYSSSVSVSFIALEFKLPVTYPLELAFHRFHSLNSLPDGAVTASPVCWSNGLLSSNVITLLMEVSSGAIIVPTPTSSLPRYSHAVTDVSPALSAAAAFSAKFSLTIDSRISFSTGSSTLLVSSAVPSVVPSG